MMEDLYDAIASNSKDNVKYLLVNDKIDPNKPNDYGDTPLHIAIESDIIDIKIVELLLAHEEIDPNSGDSVGDTPLHIAIKSGNSEIVKHLLAHKNIDPNSGDTNGDTPLHIAIESENSEIVIKLLDKGVKVNALNYAMTTPLELVETNIVLDENNLNLESIHKLLFEKGGVSNVLTELYDSIDGYSTIIVVKKTNDQFIIDPGIYKLNGDISLLDTGFEIIQTFKSILPTKLTELSKITLNESEVIHTLSIN